MEAREVMNRKTTNLEGLSEQTRRYLLESSLELLRRNEARPIFLVVSGAHKFGFPSQDSDVDIRGAFTYSLDKLHGFETPKETIDTDVKSTAGQPVIDFSIKEIKPYLIGLVANKGNYIEQLYSPLVLYTTPAHKAIKTIVSGCLSARLYDFYRNFARNVRDEGEKTNRLKNHLYAVRLYLTGAHLLRTGEVVTDLTKLNGEGSSLIREMIESKRRGEQDVYLGDLSKVREMLDGLAAKLDAARQSTILPEVPDAEAVGKMETFLKKFRREYGDNF